MNPKWGWSLLALPNESLYSMDWFKGKSTGNHRFSHSIWGIPVNFPLDQSIDLHGVAFSKVSVDALVEAEGSCAFQATKKRFLSMGGFLKWGYTPVHHRFQ